MGISTKGNFYTYISHSAYFATFLLLLGLAAKSEIQITSLPVYNFTISLAIVKLPTRTAQAGGFS